MPEEGYSGHIHVWSWETYMPGRVEKDQFWTGSEPRSFRFFRVLAQTWSRMRSRTDQKGSFDPYRRIHCLHSDTFCASDGKSIRANP